MINTPKPTTRQGPDYWDPGTQRGFNPTDDHALAMDRGGAAVGIGIVIWMGIEGAKVIKNLIDSLPPKQRERLFLIIIPFKVWRY